MARSRKAAILAALLCGLLLPACGNERTPAPDLDTIGAGGIYSSFEAPSGEVSFRYPSTWAVLNVEQGPLLAQIGTGAATATVYAYRRTDLPLGENAIKDSRDRLIKSLRKRDPSFTLIRSKITRVDGAPAVELLGDGTVDGTKVRTRAFHVYTGVAEYVIDAYALRAKFDKADEIGFGPLISTINFSTSA